METLAGGAITLVLIYAGYRVTSAGSDAGEFMSFITAFLLAYEPAKRLARLNIDQVHCAIRARGDVREEHLGKPARALVDRVVVRDLLRRRVVVGKDVLGVEIGLAHVRDRRTDPSAGQSPHFVGRP